MSKRIVYEMQSVECEEKKKKIRKKERKKERKADRREKKKKENKIKKKKTCTCFRGDRQRA
jgi:hypothetical protein